MGYYTNYMLHLDVYPTPRETVEAFFDTNRDVIEKAILEYKPDRYENYYDFDYVKGACVGGEYKWYHYHEHMQLISQLFPTMQFILVGVGEEFGDNWISVYQDAKIEKRHPKIPGYQSDFEDEDIMQLIQMR